MVFGFSDGEVVRDYSIVRSCCRYFVLGFELGVLCLFFYVVFKFIF